MTLGWLLLLGCDKPAAQQVAESKAKPAPAVAVQDAPARVQQVPESHAAYAVKWSTASALEMRSPADAASLYRKSEPELFGELKGEGKTVRPANCVEWTELHAKHYEPTSGVEETPDSGAKLRCSTLQWIERARPAHKSFVRDLTWDSAMLPLLPIEIATAVHGEDERAIADARAAGKTFVQLDPNARVKASTDKEMLELIEGDKHTMIILYPMAWGDSDGDGFDDMAVAVINAATKGSLSYNRLLTVTRNDADARLRVIGVVGVH